MTLRSLWVKKVKPPRSMPIFVFSLLLQASYGFSEESHVSDGIPSSAAIRCATERIAPAIVTVETQAGPCETAAWASYRQDERDPTRAGLYEASRRQGNGTGFFFDAQGHVLTCHHGIAEADVVFVRLPDGRRLSVEKILADPATDIAVLKVAGVNRLTTAPIGSSKGLSVGDWILTIGNPYGIGISVSAGIISAKERTLADSPYLPLIQTDAASNPGSSGGPVVNLRGEVVGMSEGGYGASGGFQGIGFAVPIDLAMNVAQRLIKDGEIERPYFGFATQSLSAELADHFGVSNGAPIVLDVERSSPAADAGILVGDVLTQMNGVQIGSNMDFFRLAERIAPGDAVEFHVIRDGESLSASITPIQRSAAVPETLVEARESAPAEAYVDGELGMTVADASHEMMSLLGLEVDDARLIITDVRPSGPAARAGLCAGMAILQIDGRPVDNIRDYRQASDSRRTGRPKIVLAAVADSKHFILMRP